VRRDLVAGAVVAGAALTALLLQGPRGRQSLVIGVVAGSGYGLIALGLVLVYKSSGIFNFAQGEFGTLAVFALWWAHSAGVPYGGAVAVGLLAALAAGLATERVVVRPLFDAPRVTLLVATAGVSLLAIGAELWLGQARLRFVAPALRRLDRVSVFGFAVSDQRLLVIGTVAALAAGGALFFTRTDLGLAIRGLSQNPMATELMGISAERLSRFTWGAAAVLGGLGGILSAPLAGGFGPGFVTLSALIPAFAAAVLGGMTSLPGALLGGIVVGVVESVAVTFPVFSDHIPGAPSVMVFALLVAVLAFRPQGLLGSRSEGAAPPGGFALPRWKARPARRAAAPARLNGHGGPLPAEPAPVTGPAPPSAAGRAARAAVAAGLAGLVLVFPLTRGGSEVNVFSKAVIYAIIGLSLNVLLGYAGQISLGHQAFVGIGAFTAAYCTTVHEQNFLAALGVTVVVGALQALLLGVVSLRVTGLYFALVSLAYGTMAERSLFNITSFTGGAAGRAALRPPAFAGDHRYYYLCLAVLAVVLFVDLRLTSTKAGRALLAIRQDPRLAAGFGADVRRYTLLAFAVAGAMASVAGALLAYNTTSVVGSQFEFQLALLFVIMTVVGGLRSRAGVVVASALFSLTDYLFTKLPLARAVDAIPVLPDLPAHLAPLVLGPLLLIFTLTRHPGGLGEVLRPFGSWLRGALGRRPVPAAAPAAVPVAGPGTEVRAGA
jgi:branched-chain amino acid transport system permease protein